MFLEYKNPGETTSEFSNRIKNKYNFTKVAICGKLDPMARGWTTVLGDNLTKNMDSYLTSDKEYEFEIVDGISTDSDDILGIIEDLSIIDSSSFIEDYLDNLHYLKKQKFHHFSAKRLNKDGVNKPLWYWYINNNLNEDEIPEKEVNVYSIKKLVKYEIPRDIYYKQVQEQLSYLKSNKFNRDNIIQCWKDTQNTDSYKKPLTIYKYRIKVSSGFYIRMIAKDLKKLGVKCHINDIHRINVSIPKIFSQD
jgi:tRNA pseudouridine(55) synthase